MKVADTFRRLHQGPELLLLANCWDAGSARLIESLGGRAVATTSAGLAWAQGYPDGDALPMERLVDAIACIARVVKVPLTVDMEGGYSDDPNVVGENVSRVVHAGAVGINLEDAGAPPAALAAKIARAKEGAARAGVDLFVNARTDVYLRGLVPEQNRIAETLARARIYREAGADGFFVPKVLDAAAIREIASNAGLPLNVLAWPGLPSASELASLGVRRLSSGSGVAIAALNRAAHLSRTFLAEGRLERSIEGGMAYADVNALFPH